MPAQAVASNKLQPNKHQQRTEATRRKLLAAAMRVFARHGFEAARIEDIASEAGHTRGAFYANFSTKEDLFLALLEHQSAKRLAQVQQAIAAAPDRDAMMQEFRRHYISRAADRQWAMLILEFKLFVLRHSKQRARLAAAHQRIRQSLHLQMMSKISPIKQPQKGFSDDGTKILLDVLLSGLVLEHSYDPTRLSAAETTSLLARMFDLLTA